LFYFCWWWWRWDGYVLGFSSCFILAHIALYIKADFGCIALYIKADFGCIASSIKVDFEIWMHRLIFFFQWEKPHFLFQGKKSHFFIPNKNEKHLIHMHMAIYESSEDIQRHLRIFKNNCPKNSRSPYYSKTAV
jgi:hypothetical protein